MSQRATHVRCALAIGGFDSGGGAGIAADLRAFGAAGAFGCAAIALITIQSTAGLRAVRPVAPRDVVAQAREVLLHQRVSAVKTGALGSAANTRAVATWLGAHPELAVVVDPVMIPTRGRARLLARDALAALRDRLVGRASLVTANAPEAALLTAARVRNVEEARVAAMAICRLGARAALVKGGHLEGREVVDVLALAGPPSRVFELRGLRLALPPLHGGGCTLAALIAGHLARSSERFARAPDEAIVQAVRWARRVHRAALTRAVDVGGPMRVLIP